MRLRQAGLRHFNVDLVYGLPRQTLETLSAPSDEAIAIAPDRFAVFGYAHVPWMKPRQAVIDAATLPGAAERAAMAGLVEARLVGAGYVKIGLDHYAGRATRWRALQHNAGCAGTPGIRRRRNALGRRCRRFGDLLPAAGLHAERRTGCSLHGSHRRRRPGTTVRGIAWSAIDRLHGDIISELMCHFEVDLAALCNRHGAPLQALLSEAPALPALIDDGLVSLDGARLAVTGQGRPLVRSVCAAFDRHYTGGEGRHARAI